MKIKPVPTPPDSFRDLHQMVEAIPAEPQDRETVLGVIRRAGPDELGRQGAIDWIALLEELGVVARELDSDRYSRRGIPEDSTTVVNRFLDSVFQARAIHRHLRATDGPVTGADCVDAGIEPTQWESLRPGDRTAVWAARCDRILAWFALLGIAERCENGYRAAVRDQSIG